MSNSTFIPTSSGGGQTATISALARQQPEDVWLTLRRIGCYESECNLALLMLRNGRSAEYVARKLEPDNPDRQERITRELAALVT